VVSFTLDKFAKRSIFKTQCVMLSTVKKRRSAGF
jgi:hypothetical protein